MSEVIYIMETWKKVEIKSKQKKNICEHGIKEDNRGER